MRYRPTPAPPLTREPARERCILNNVRGTPGQAFTATITYFEGYNESAFGVSINDAITMINTSTQVIRELSLPCMSQVRVVHPSTGLLAFTTHEPKTLVFEFGLINDPSFALFEQTLIDALKAQGVKYTLHWSKNSGIDAQNLVTMYGEDRIKRWRRAREVVFEGNMSLMSVFDNSHLQRAGLA